jgi:hypothetical protein
MMLCLFFHRQEGDRSNLVGIPAKKVSRTAAKAAAVPL